MDVVKRRLGDLLVNYDYLRKPLSSIERESFHGSYPYYGAQGIIDYVKEYRCDGEYLLIAEDGENLSSRNEPIAQIAQGKFWVNNHAHIVRTNDLADIRFICYTLNSSDIAGYVTGSAQPKLSQANLNKIILNLPDLDTQRRIASILSAYDNLIENNNRRIRLLEQMAENLYKEWFVRFRFPGHEKVEMENGLPKGWRYAKLEDVLSLKDSTRIPLSSIERSNMQKIYPYYGAASILDYVSDYLFDGVYLLLGEDGSVIDENGYPYIQYVWGKFWVNNHAHVIEKKGVYSVEFLYCMFKKMNIQSIVTGVAQPKISQGRLFNKKVIIPCDSIISLFDKQIQPIFAEIRQLTNQITNLTRQRDLLLPRLMSGKLEVNA